jgi:hypothetical protein
LQGRELEIIFQTISHGQIVGGLKKMLKSAKLKCLKGPIADYE